MVKTVHTVDSGMAKEAAIVETWVANGSSNGLNVDAWCKRLTEAVTRVCAQALHRCIAAFCNPAFPQTRVYWWSDRKALPDE